MSVGTEVPQVERTRVGSGASVRVNLLPQATREGAKAARQKAAALLGVGVLVVGLGAVSFWQRGQLAAAEQSLVAAQADRDAAQSAVNDLAVFASLEQELLDAHGAVRLALGDQATLAGVLQDLAMVMPEDTSFNTLDVSFEAGEEAAGLGTLRATGDTLQRFAPGVERMLLQLGRAAGFGEAYLTTASVDEQEIVTFDLDLRLGSEHRTNRYVDGIPEVLR